MVERLQLEFLYLNALGIQRAPRRSNRNFGVFRDTTKNYLLASVQKLARAKAFPLIRELFPVWHGKQRTFSVAEEHRPLLLQQTILGGWVP